MSRRIGKNSDDEYKARKLRGQQEQARRTPYNFKMRNGGAKYEKNIQSRMLQKGASREVMVKITGSANRPRGVKNEINYIAREGEITLRDNNGVEYHIADRAGNNEKKRMNRLSMMKIKNSIPMTVHLIWCITWFFHPRR